MRTRLRTVEFTDSVQWSFAGNVAAAAVAVGDVDNDGHHEFVVGNVKGVLAVFKGLASSKPWKVCHNLGTISCIAVGDVLNVRKNMLVCLTAEGWCHIFDMVAEKDAAWADAARETVVLPGPTLTLPLPVNVARCAIGDMDGDGHNELIVAHTDRNLEVYRLQSKFEDEAGAEASQDGDGPQKLARRKSLTSRVELATVHTRQLPGQSGSIVVTQRPGEGSAPFALIAQPGGAFVTLDGQGTLQTDSAPSDPNMGYFRGGAATELVHLGVGAEIVVVSVDGAIKMLDAGLAKRWELLVNQQLFSLTRIDVNGDGQAEAVACSWDGLTYFIDAHCDVVRFQFGDDVCAFTAGTYAHTPEHASQCLFYINYADQITVYHDVRVTNMAMRRFTDVVAEDVLPEFADRLETTPDGVRLRGSAAPFVPLPQLIEAALYGGRLPWDAAAVQ
eukprot:Unigene17579_Nuclearia_a/m.51343 Unigene17579_Nuclearia_a/g.51343  ORF Unigene17579_Nuclearia_a/g.51343 Unigene17579_Nuclearia_a/m.51343 type:complete len:445 (-) Unigene17579_Nuclearia_a:107-1441(-)